MKHSFIVNTNAVNAYGYRVLTQGIDFSQYMRNPVVLFMHNRAYRGNEVIGRCTRLYIEEDKLIADVEFDTQDEFANQIAGKVERGFIRMASIYADIQEVSAQPEHILDGQMYETVTACKLIEISIVDIGGNDNALKLSKDGKPVQLNKIVIEKKVEDMELKTIALALGLSEDIKEENLLKEAQALRLAKETAEQELNQLKAERMKMQVAQATELVDKAITLGLLPEALKASQLKQFEADFEGQKSILLSLIADKESADKLNGKAETVRQIVLNKTGKPDGATDESFDFLQKHNPERLRAIRDEQPEEYARLAKDYASGVRYKGTK